MSLYAALGASAEALQNFERALTVVQNNVVNASTPGFAKQRQTFVAKEFYPEQGLVGGAALAQRENARNQFAERGVRRQTSLAGRFDEMVTTLAQIETVFDATGESGIPAALSELFDSFSALSVSPNDPTARRLVLDRAGQAVRAFQSTSQSLSAAEAEARKQVPALVDRINTLAGLIRTFNTRVRQNFEAAADAGLDAQLHSTLEQISEIVDVQVLHQPDGTVTVLLGGQTPLVIGEHQYTVQADSSNSAVRLLDFQGQDVTAQVTGGRLSGAFEVVNTLVPSYRSDLNVLAASLADNVNATLGAGLDQYGLPGTPLFSYNLPGDAASTLALTTITPEQLAAASTTAPGGNGNALDLANLGRTLTTNGQSFAGFYGKLVASVGRELATAGENQDTQRQLVAQARVLRADLQGVSLDEEAARLVELQRAYQAAARMVTVLDELTAATINMLR